MLVVTFTERAAAELVRRIRALIRRCSGPQPRADEPAGPHVWIHRRRGARRGWRRCARPRRRADLDHPRLLPARPDRARVRERPPARAERRSRAGPPSPPRSTRSFADAWTASCLALLAAWLAAGSDVARMEALAVPGAQPALRVGDDLRSRARSRTRPRALRGDAPRRTRAPCTMRVDTSAPKHVVDRVDCCTAACARFVAHGEPACLLARDRCDSCEAKEIFDFILDPIAWAARATNRASRRCWRASRRSRTRPSRWRPRSRSGSGRSSRSACAPASAPRASTTSTTCCALVDEALRGPRGAELAATLRAALPPGRHRRVPGHRPGAVADLPHDLPRRRRRRGRSTWSAIRSSRSTASAAPTSAPTTARAPRSPAPGGVQHLRAQLPLDAGGHRRLQRDLRSEGRRSPFFSTGLDYDHPVTYGGKESEPVDRIAAASRCSACRPTTRRQLPMRVVRAALARRDRRRDRRAAARRPEVRTRARSSC